MITDADMGDAIMERMAAGCVIPPSDLGVIVIYGAASTNDHERPVSVPSTPPSAKA